ncbi:nuclear transport factor 2 family protein [Amycolatopsis sp. K13G38]|uniref:Nuclear transport factor 2 family protein n=1 Tax=Amycolatopsis acididurans TaxID=2724524 RepID=A0ABX1JBP8_9PSEU|nr:nuclear transport factor 2 family protein [Amycolatopsis acididurans]NKQ57222.1 nuclear transport factor 2 family protein [Amycolatopsis acididurans]
MSALHGAVPPSATECADRLAITDVIHRYSRGLDRMDRALTLSCWHPGGTDDHAPLYKGTAAGFVDWLWPVHAAMLCTRHVVTNTIIDLAGNEAGVETYWTLTLRIPSGDGAIDSLSGGRYLDRFERRAGAWAIQHRVAVRDWARTDPVPAVPGKPLIRPNNPEAPGARSTRDRFDESYGVLRNYFDQAIGSI